MFRLLNNLLDGVAFVMAEAKGIGWGSRKELLEGEDVGRGEIADVDIVADTGAVGGLVVISMNRNGGNFPKGSP
ncbi:MAG: hypothetical protein OHK0012_20000 [Synechococcales cyanobacterium]